MTTGPRILVKRRDEHAWTAPEAGTYSNEAHLQSVLAADPSHIPGVAPGARTTCEFPTQAGPIDVCVVGLDGALTVVECKLASNSERRRMVIGQVLDYAAAIWNAGPEQFFATWKSRTGTDLAELLDSGAVDQLSGNIQNARIDLCLAVDAIDADLRRMVEYLNRTSRTDVAVTALQLTYARHDDVEILIPATFGGEIAAAKDPSNRAPGVHWTRELLVESCTDDKDKRVIQRLLDLVDGTEQRETHDKVWFGLYPGGGVFFHPYGFDKPPFQVWTTNGTAFVCGNWSGFPTIARHPGFAPIAAALGLSHDGPQRQCRLADIDIEAFWLAALESAVLING